MRNRLLSKIKTKREPALTLLILGGCIFGTVAWHYWDSRSILIAFAAAIWLFVEYFLFNRIGSALNHRVNKKDSDNNKMTNPQQLVAPTLKPPDNQR